jgi:hypothetical protein
VDYISRQVELVLGTLTAGEKVPVPVTLQGVELKYPKWMLSKPGHELLPVYQKVFGQLIITPPKLEKSFRRVRLVPNELAEIMTQLQTV